MKRFAFVALLGLVSSMIAAAQAYAPMVNMNVVPTNGEMRQVTAPESGLAVVALADGTEYGFRPTILDSQPWHRVTVTIFKMAAGSEATPRARRDRGADRRRSCALEDRTRV